MKQLSVKDFGGDLAPQRRDFLTRLALALAAVTGVSLAQEAIMEKGQAKVCDSDALTCPNGHKTCKSINAPPAVGNDAYQNMDVAPLKDFHLERCEVCRVAFFRE
jgi:hypothetical protein